MAKKNANDGVEMFKASHRTARISARKARLVMDLIRGQSVESALTKLRFCERRSAPMIRKVVESAAANAAQKASADPADLVVHSCFVDEGPTLKRWRPRSMGRAFPRLKRTSHLTVNLRVDDDLRAANAKARAAETSADEPAGEE